MRLNLLPGKIKSDRNIAFQAGLHLKGFLWGFASFWIISFLFLSFLGYRISDMKRALAEITTELKNTEPLIRERDALLRRRQELSGFLIILEKDFKGGVVWSRKLAAFSYLVPNEIWLKEISFFKQGLREGTLDVWAAASYLKSDDELLEKINNFIERIKGDSDFFRDFQNLTLLEINKAGSREEHIMDFKFRIFLTPTP